jgi:hypothetical protein
MRVLAAAALCFMTAINSPVYAESVSPDAAAAKPENLTDSFNDLDHFFVKNYGAAAGINQTKSRPIIVVMGFEFKLVGEDGSIKVATGAGPRFDQLKSVAHIGACLFPFAVRHWNDPSDQTWLTDMATCNQKLKNVSAHIDTADWSSDAWPDGADKLKKFVKASLQKSIDFTDRVLAKKELTRDDYANFAQEYEPTMATLFYLETLGDMYGALKTIKDWKKDMGPEKWSNLYVVVGGSQGRTTAGLTWDTNPSALLLASLMDREQASTHIVIAPATSTVEQALQIAGMTMNAKDLSQAMFPTAEAQKKSTFYAALQDFAKPVALGFVNDVLKGLSDGTAKDPVLGLGPKI